MDKKLVSWVIPIYNEEFNIPKLWEALESLRTGISDRYNAEFIFIDDGSRDRSMDLLTKLYEQDKDVKVLSFSRNFGHQTAITAGLDIAVGDAVIFIDSDLQDPPEVCYELIKKWEEGFDVAYAKRRTRRDSFLKKLTAKWFYRILQKFADIKIPEDTGDFRLISKQVADTLRSFRERHRFIRGLVSYVGFKQTAVVFDRKERTAGVSGYSIKKMLKLASDGLTGFSLTPIQMVGTVGIFASVVGIVGVIASAFMKNWQLALGAYMTILTGVLLIAMNILGQFIGRTYQEIQGRPLYIVKTKLEHQ